MKVIFDLKRQIYFPVLYKIFRTNLCFLFFEREMFTFTAKNMSLENLKRVQITIYWNSLAAGHDNILCCVKYL